MGFLHASRSPWQRFPQQWGRDIRKQNSQSAEVGFLVVLFPDLLSAVLLFLPRPFNAALRKYRGTGRGEETQRDD